MGPPRANFSRSSHTELMHHNLCSGNHELNVQQSWDHNKTDTK